MQAHLLTIVCKFGRKRAVCLREKATLGRALKCPYHVTFDLDLDLEHTLDAGSPADHRVQVWSQSSHLPSRKSDFRSITNVLVSVTFDLDLDLEHTVDVGSPADHRVQDWWQSSHLPARKSDFRSSTKIPVSRDL